MVDSLGPWEPWLGVVAVAVALSVTGAALVWEYRISRESNLDVRRLGYDPDRNPHAHPDPDTVPVVTPTPTAAATPTPLPPGVTVTPTPVLEGPATATPAVQPTATPPLGPPTEEGGNLGRASAAAVVGSPAVGV